MFLSTNLHMQQLWVTSEQMQQQSAGVPLVGIGVDAGSTDATLATAAVAAAELSLPLRTAAAPLGGRGPAVRAGCALATGEVLPRFARWN